MNLTKHDLSAGIAKLNLNDLINFASRAVTDASLRCERANGRFQGSYLIKDKYDRLREYASAAKELRLAADNLAVACENLHYLEEASKREKLYLIVNQDNKNA